MFGFLRHKRATILGRAVLLIIDPVVGLELATEWSSKCTTGHASLARQ